MRAQADEHCQYLGDPEVFGDCVEYLEEEGYMEYCKADICAQPLTQTRRTLCNYLAAVARVCLQMGMQVNWMESSIKTKCEGVYIYIDGLMQDCSNPSTLATELLPSGTKANYRHH